MLLPIAPPLGGETLLEPSNYHTAGNNDCYKLQKRENPSRFGQEMGWKRIGNGMAGRSRLPVLWRNTPLAALRRLGAGR